MTGAHTRTREMTRVKAIKLAIRCLRERKQYVAYDANSYNAGFHTAHGERRAKEYAELCEAIDILEKMQEEP